MKREQTTRGLRRVLWLVPVGALLPPAFLLSCGDSPTEPAPPARPEGPRPTSVSVSPASATLSALGDELQLTAQVLDQNRRPLSGVAVTWTSSNGSIASVSGSGLVRAVGDGETTITAAAGSAASGTAIVTVRQVTVSATVTPAADTLVVGDTLRLAAEAFDANGQAVSGATFSWSSSEPAVATVDTTGLVTAASPGESVITAASGAAAGTAVLAVVRVASSVVLSPETAGLSPGDTLRLAAEASDANGQAISDPAFAWSSDAPGIATVDTTGLVTAVSPGRAVISAASGDASGRMAVHVAAPFPATITVTPGDAALASAGDTIRLAAKAFDQFGRLLPDESVSWSSDDESVATVDAAGLVRGAGPGIATIAARAGRAESTSRIAVGNADGAALVALYHATDGPNWSQNDNWLTDAPLDQWFGVQIDDRGRVTGLSLWNNNLSGSVPPETGSLTHLQNLNLQANQLSGAIPPELGNLASLEDINLGHNRLSGVIPPELGSLASLRAMRLTWNKLSGTIPPELGNLAHVEILALSHNRFTGALPPELGNLGHLRRLDLTLNRLSGVIPPELGNLSNLEQLRLTSNSVSGPIPPELGNLANLKELRLPVNELTGTIPPEFGKLASLEILTLGYNRLTGAIPPELGDLASLNTLFVDGNQLTGTIPPELGNLARLDVLHLGNNALTGTIPPELGRPSELRVLIVSTNRLSGSLPGNLATLSKLEQLALGENHGLCAPGTATFATWVENIRLVSAPFCNEFDEANLVALFEAAGGEGWTRSDGWLGGAVLEEWYGVGADSLGYVATLDLTGNGLAGRIPSSLGKLSRLTELRIGGNQLSGRLPRSLTRLPIRELRYADTGLCVPADTAFFEWLSAVPVHEGTGETCGSFADRDILAELYEVTGGSRWRNQENWITEAPLEEWHGVTVNAEGHVTELVLASNNLSGSIPPALGGLTDLRVLQLQHNELGGSIPPELGSLASLEQLNLFDNRLSGPIPPELGDLVQLREFWLEHNELTGSIPPRLGDLTNLEILRLNTNRLVGSIPPELGNLARLRILLLSANRLSGTIPTELGSLAGLRSLVVGNNELTGSIPSELGNLTRLLELDLSSSQLSGPIPRGFGNLAQLLHLRLSGNELTGTIPLELGQLASLKELRLDSNRLAGRVPSALGQLTHLTALQLSQNPGLSGALPMSLTALRGLETLGTAGTDLCAPSNTDFQAWLAPVAVQRIGRCAVGGGSTTLYLTQAVQSRSFPVPLVAGEPAFLRVFVTTPYATLAEIPSARATFHLNGSETYTAEMPARMTPIPTAVDESDLEPSLNVEIPGEVIQPGLEIVVDIDPDGMLDPRLGVTRRIPEEGRLPLDVRAMPTLDLTLIPFLWSEAPDSAIVESVKEMAADPVEHELLWATRTLIPVADMEVTAHEPVLSSSNNPLALYRQTYAIWIMEGRRGHYMSLMSGPTSTNIAGAALRPGRVAFSKPDEYVIAHELGHNMSLAHAPCGLLFDPDPEYPESDGAIGAWGYDFRGEDGLVSPYLPDLMTYCRPPWIGEYHFSKALRFRLADEGGATAAGAGARRVRSLLLWGGIDRDNDPFLEPAFVVHTPAELPAPGGGAFELAGRAADGDTLFLLPFDMPEIPDGEGSSSFAFTLPVETGWDGELASITLSGPGGTAVLDGETDRPMVILRNPRTGQVRGFLRDPPPAAFARGRVDSSALSPEQGLEALFSRGLPSFREGWR